MSLSTVYVRSVWYILSQYSYVIIVQFMSQQCSLSRKSTVYVPRVQFMF